jgi:tol-pal system protein YbgF
MTTAMKRRSLSLAASAMMLAGGLLAGCGPGNTLAVGKGSDDFRLRAVESSLQKAQEELKAVAGRQQQNDGRLAEIQKQIAAIRASLEGQGLKVPAGASRGSALGQGFAHPEAALGGPGQERPAEGASSGPSDRGTEPGAPPPDAAGMAPATAQAANHGAESAGPPAGLPPSAVRPAAPPQTAAAASEAYGKRGLGRVGPAAAPATPEAAIAADRLDAGPTPKAETGPKAGAAPPASPSPAAAPEPQPAKAETPAKAEAPGKAETPAKADKSAKAAPPAPAPADPTAPPASALADASAGPKEPAPKGSGPAPGYAEAASPAQKAEYNRALQLAINGRTAEAKTAFDQFLANHPSSPLTPNALYWVGEGAFAQGDYMTAIADFDKVAKGWPGHHKAADSLYKMAMAQEKAGNMAAARASLERYLKDYPNAELAAVARQKLQALPK